MENINSTIFRYTTDTYAVKTDIAITYSVLCEHAIDDIKWAADHLTKDPTSTYAKELYRAGIATIDAATVMLLRTAYPRKDDIFMAASRLVNIKCKRLGIKRYI